MFTLKHALYFIFIRRSHKQARTSSVSQPVSLSAEQVKAVENGNVLVKWKFFKMLSTELLDKAAVDRRCSALYSADIRSKLENTKRKEKKATNSQRGQISQSAPPPAPPAPPAPPPEDELCVCSTLQD